MKRSDQGASESKMQSKMANLAQQAMVGWLNAAKEAPIAEQEEIKSLVSGLFAHSIHTSQSAQKGEHVHKVQNGAGYSLMHLFQTSKMGPIKQDLLGMKNNKAAVDHAHIYQKINNTDLDTLISAAENDAFFQAAAGNRFQNLNNNGPMYDDTFTLLETSGFLGRSGIQPHGTHNSWGVPKPDEVDTPQDNFTPLDFSEGDLVNAIKKMSIDTDGNEQLSKSDLKNYSGDKRLEELASTFLAHFDEIRGENKRISFEEGMAFLEGVSPNNPQGNYGVGVSATDDNSVNPIVDGPREGQIRTITDSIVVKSGETYDGQGETILAKGMGDGSQKENQKPIFVLEDGAVLKNVTIGPPGCDGIHTFGDAKLDNVQWTDVGEDALTMKKSGTVEINGGSAADARDKVFQLNAPGKLIINDFQAANIGKLVRQNGGTDFKTEVHLNNVTVSGCRSGIVVVDDSANKSEIYVKNLRANDTKTLFEGFSKSQIHKQ
jgi:hypothetical protein